MRYVPKCSWRPVDAADLVTAKPRPLPSRKASRASRRTTRKVPGMVHLGYKLSSEEFGPTDLVRFAARAEGAGFDFALISDHFHPWTDRQGESPFVWSVLGAMAHGTRRLRVGPQSPVRPSASTRQSSHKRQPLWRLS
jgi:hypothetical protein